MDQEFTDDQNEQWEKELENGDVPMKWAENKPIKAGDAIKRARQVVFLKAFGECGTLKQAARAAGVNASTHRRWLANDPWFKAQFQDALAAYRDTLAEEIHNRAVHGEEVPIIGKVQTELGPEDRIIGYKRQKSDLLLMFHAKKIDPSYRENYNPPPSQETDREMVSPLTRLVLTLDVMQQRTVEPVESEHRIIDVTPEKPKLPSPEDHGSQE